MPITLDLDLSFPPSSASPRALDAATDGDLDALPFGVIGLSQDGTVETYNLYESLLARLDRKQVIGRKFFTEIAPCTAVPEFEGRVYVLHAGISRSSRFEFVFDFKSGAQQVGVGVLPRARGGAFLVVNRQRVLSRRSGVPEAMLAAAQPDLAPDELSFGVVRDELQRRVVNLPAPFFGALRATCEKLAPETWQLFAGEWGLAWGRRAAVDLEAAALTSWQRSLREITMHDAASLICQLLSGQGWGALAFDFGRAHEGLVLADLERSALAETAASRAQPRAATCHLMAGFLGGVLTHIAGHKLVALEYACQSTGHERCAFAITGQGRRAQLERAVREGAGDVETVARLLLEKPA